MPDKPLDEVLGMCVSDSETHAPLLANRKEPYYRVKQERPAHRVMTELAAQGYDVKEISAKLGYHPVTVNNILRQGHSQQTLVDACRKYASEDDEVVELIKGNVVKAVETLKEVMQDPNAKGSERIAAAEALLNRRYGKPNQPVNRNTDVDLNKMSDADLAAMLPTERTATNA